MPVKFDPRRLDLGTAYQYQTLVRSVQLTNASTNNLTITAAHSTCGCTVLNSNLVGSEVRAGQSIPITLSFDSGGRDGAWSSAVTVRLDDPKGGASYMTQVELFGDVFADFSIEPTVLRFGEVNPGETKVRYVAIIPKLTKTFQIVSIESSRTEFIATATTAGTNTVPVGLDIQFIVPKAARRETLSGLIKVSTTAPRLREFQIRVEGIVVPDIEAIPQTLVFAGDVTNQNSRLLIRTREASVVKQMTVHLVNGMQKVLNVAEAGGWQKEHPIVIPAESIQEAKTISVTVVMGKNPDRNEARQIAINVIGLNNKQKEQHEN